MTCLRQIIFPLCLICVDHMSEKNGQDTGNWSMEVKGILRSVVGFPEGILLDFNGRNKEPDKN